MAEIKTPLKELVEGSYYTASAGEYLITEANSLADILRFIVEQADKDTIQMLLDELDSKPDKVNHD